MKSLFATLTLSLVLFPFPLRAGAAVESPEARGLAVAVEADRRSSGFGDFTADMTMTLRNRSGQESTRRIRIRTLEVEADGDKSLTIFDSPRDVKGTAFLNYTHKSGDDDQWLFLPALKRVKRISSRNKSGSFMGSEFSYEDISSQEVEKYAYRLLGKESVDGRECFVVEFVPVDRKNSGYTRQVTWIDVEEYRTLKVEYYDRRNAHLKTLVISGYDLYLDRFWRASRMEMQNHQNGKGTVLKFSDYRFATGLTDRDFTKNSLKRAR